MGEKIGIALVDKRPLGIDYADEQARHCTFIGRARQGGALWAKGEDIICPLARFNLGIDPQDASTVDTLAQTLIDWGDAEDMDTARRFIAGLSPLPVARRFFVYAPLNKMPFSPDVVLLILPPQEAFSRVLSLTQVTGERSGGPIGAVGALCGECTAWPLNTNRAAVSLGCNGSRREAHLGPDELFLSLPFSLYQSTIGQ